MFRSEEGLSTEYHAVITSSPENPFIHDSVSEAEDYLEQFLDTTKLSMDNLIFSRIYFSDIANQKSIIENSPVYDLLSSNSTVSIIEQPASSGANLIILLYLIDGKNIEKETKVIDEFNHTSSTILSNKTTKHIWTANLVSNIEFDSYKQTQQIFDNYDKILKENNSTLIDHSIRTWIYVRDIDNHYMGMVDARRELFEEEGLTAKTHYISSTGIEARIQNVNNLVSMDALTIPTIKQEQITFLEALEHLNPTHEYGVTFERGTKVDYSDRTHYYISGTASIDNKGDVVHIGDIKKQTHRTLENINALLNPHGAALNDMAYLIVYLRDFGTEKIVREIIKETIDNDIPMIIVQGAVCRPTWLIEMEGVAIKRNKNSELPSFFS
jgi:enamine deaminase RidA (YjgF/YER057c/UK114 family)